jgi:hypothetical protein
VADTRLGRVVGALVQLGEAQVLVEVLQSVWPPALLWCNRLHSHDLVKFNKLRFNIIDKNCIIDHTNLSLISKKS